MARGATKTALSSALSGRGFEREARGPGGDEGAKQPSLLEVEEEEERAIARRVDLAQQLRLPARQAEEPAPQALALVGAVREEDGASQLGREACRAEGSAAGGLGGGSPWRRLARAPGAVAGGAPSGSVPAPGSAEPPRAARCVLTRRRTFDRTPEPSSRPRPLRHHRLGAATPLDASGSCSCSVLTRGVAFAWPTAVAAVAAASTAAVGARALAPASTLSAPSALRSRLGGGRPLELHPASTWAPRPSSPPATPAPFPAPTSISALSGPVSAISGSLSRSTSVRTRCACCSRPCATVRGGRGHHGPQHAGARRRW